jgi:type IV pilus assembly protein PilZ
LVELRRFTRAPLETPLQFSNKKGDRRERVEGIARDISVGGMFIESQLPAGFGDEIVVYLTLPGSATELVLPGVVRWTRSGGMGVQFGLLGARETHAITEIVKQKG